MTSSASTASSAPKKRKRKLFTRKRFYEFMIWVFRGRHIVFAVFIASALVAFYWLSIAPNRYVSESNIIIQRTDFSGGQSIDFATLLGGGGGANRADQLLLRNYLLSVDMLQKLDKELNLRKHYNAWRGDPISRLWESNASMESFHKYYLSRINIELDEYSGVLVIKTQAFDSKMAQAINKMLVLEGERFMNEMAHQLAQEQVKFLENKLVEVSQQAIQARITVLEFQNKNGLVSPEGSAQTIANIVGQLEGKLSEWETQRTAMQAYLVPDHPNLIQINQQIEAVQKQIAVERARLASPNGKALNSTVEEFQRLEMQATFAQDMYKTALVALEKGRIETTRTIKKVSILQASTEPQDSVQPRRIYNSIVFTLMALLIAGIVHLLVAIVRDHKD